MNDYVKVDSFKYVICLPDTDLLLTEMNEGAIVFKPEREHALVWKSWDAANTIAKEFGCTVGAIPCEG